MHQYKLRHVIPNENVREAWYVTCRNCSYVSEESRSQELALAMGMIHQQRVARKNQVLAWRKRRLLPPTWVVSHESVLHALVPVRHVMKPKHEANMMCGGKLTQQQREYPTAICFRCIQKYNRWLLYISRIALPLDLLRNARLEQYKDSNAQLVIESKSAVAENQKLIRLLAGAQNEVNALRHYISFAVDKLYAEHGIKPPPREVSSL